MMNNKGSLNIFTNLGLLLIIGLVSLGTFGAHLLSDRAQPALKGRTGADVVGLQIAVTASTDVDAYMDAMEELGVRGTFFFCAPDTPEEALIDEVAQRGYGVGYYTCAADDEEAGMYIGGGYSVPVMSYVAGDTLRQVCPSINLVRLTRLSNWPDVLRSRLAGDMFLYIDGDNDQAGFKKIVQIVHDKGYTILKVDEML